MSDGQSTGSLYFNPLSGPGGGGSVWKEPPLGRQTPEDRSADASPQTALTRTPPVIHALSSLALRDRVSGAARRMRGRKLAYLGTGLALAGAGAATAAGALAGVTGGTAGLADARPVTHAIAAPANPGGHGGPAPHPRTWLAIERVVAGRTSPQAGHGSLPAQDRLTPAGTSGPQTWMAISPARYANAATIVRQAIDKKMGLRSAVIAVATAMQESTLLNISFGDRDSLGLFQQRPSAGWGSAGQILNPAYAADAFLSALHSYQGQDPAWAHQPLWQSAQKVQESGVPYAYAKWEAQAAHLVASITHQIV